MKRLSLVLRISAIVAAVAAAGLFFMAQGKLTEKQAEVDAANASTQQVQNELNQANSDIQSLEASLAEEREALASSKRDLETVRSEMYTAKQEVTRTQQQLREANQELGKLKDDNKKLRADLLLIEQSLAKASKEGEIAQLNERIKELEAANNSLTSELQSAKAISSARKVSSSASALRADGLPVVNPPVNNSPAVQPASIGTKTTIASIDAQNGLIVLNTTPELGLIRGLEITLVKDLKALGNVQVSALKDGFAIANILPGAKTHEMVAGSTVSLLR